MSSTHLGMSSTFTNKPHFVLLDGLRGVAALIVVVYHLFECYDWSPMPRGYLAVDFFFVLSGFVIGYAYDDRWSSGLTTWQFARRRLIRLHPMVVLGAVIGVVAFLLQGATKWTGIAVPLSTVLCALVLNLVMCPLSSDSTLDVRGNGEMFPLNGPNWSLFFEYLGNVCYALLLRFLPTRWLAGLVLLLSEGIIALSVHEGYLGVGWTMAEGGFWYGMLRMLLPYSIGMLMARKFKPLKLQSTFWPSTLTLLFVATFPLLLGHMPMWMSGLYDALCVIVVFPFVVWMGASAAHLQPQALRHLGRLGDLSYPLYAVHYPLMYYFYAHIGFSGSLVPIAHFADSCVMMGIVFVLSIALAYAAFHLYDRPIRRWLNR